MAFALPIRADRRRKNAPKAVSVRPTVTAASRHPDRIERAAVLGVVKGMAVEKLYSPPGSITRGGSS
jgi:hypothetical protein